MGENVILRPRVYLRALCRIIKGRGFMVYLFFLILLTFPHYIL